MLYNRSLLLPSPGDDGRVIVIENGAVVAAHARLLARWLVGSGKKEKGAIHFSVLGSFGSYARDRICCAVVSLCVVLRAPGIYMVRALLIDKLNSFIARHWPWYDAIPCI